MKVTRTFEEGIKIRTRKIMGKYNVKGITIFLLHYYNNIIIIKCAGRLLLTVDTQLVEALNL